MTWHGVASNAGQGGAGSVRAVRGVAMQDGMVLGGVRFPARPLNTAWRGEAWQGAARPGGAGLGTARPGRARRGKDRAALVRSAGFDSPARPLNAVGLGATRLGLVRRGGARPGKDRTRLAPSAGFDSLLVRSTWRGWARRGRAGMGTAQARHGSARPERFGRARFRPAGRHRGSSPRRSLNKAGRG